MEWAEVGTIIAAVTALVGLQSFWIARALDGARGELGGLRGEMHREFDRVEARFDRLDARLQRLERGDEPPSLRRV